ncbi:hypothetical protein BO86DRAFT_5596 [Aspergillus japonicus CBS 114.51]|uniref:Uncharacterized protein n=1 Tax=Aspergillus japonicus CBS 114.51 TaxID=1448312 RepID=A0A8T8XH19_ASPJA|nr:hypothetical protein BO86DRAFT_5596 [Aspergillus japonicus CBS 114.51]RAH87556.1 hypothetical protein BO86DRAFT_5596 [Aspergillus japonicus CBS 114.51]
MSTVLCTYSTYSILRVDNLFVTPTYSLCLVLSTVVFLQGLQPGQVMTTNSDTKRISLTLPVSHSLLTLSYIFTFLLPFPPPSSFFYIVFFFLFHSPPPSSPLIVSFLPSSSSLLSPIPLSPSLLLPFLIIPSGYPPSPLVVALIALAYLSFSLCQIKPTSSCACRLC